LAGGGAPGAALIRCASTTKDRAQAEESGMQTPRFETIELRVEEPRAWLTLNRPDRLNAVGATMMREVVEAVQWLDRRPDIRLMVLSGYGRAFSAGADLRDSSTADAGAQNGGGWAARREVGQRGLRMINALEQMRAITIAQVHGYAIGGGILLMAACDLRVVAAGTVFSIPEVELGIPLAWGGIPRLVREIGPAMTKELVMTCRRFSAEEAKQLGMINRLVPLERLEQEVESLAAELLRMPGGPLIITKDQVNQTSERMASGLTASLDGDLLLGSLLDEAGAQARRAYTERTFKRPGGGAA
jgi:enoyl-CoA hydratase/carnithine racemase